PLVDSLRIIKDARIRIEHQIETTLRLEPAAPALSASDRQPAGPTEVTEIIFRVSAGAVAVSKGLSIVGTRPGLGALVPNRIAMHEDGTGGEQRAGDGVWSYAATFPVGTRLFYVYTNSGREGQWEGLDVPTIRQLVVPSAATGRFYPPIDSFGKIYMQADN